MSMIFQVAQLTQKKAIHGIRYKVSMMFQVVQHNTTELHGAVWNVVRKTVNILRFSVFFTYVVKLLFKPQIGLFVLFMVPVHDALAARSICPGSSPLIAEMQKIACITPDLREAVQTGLLKRISNINPFASGKNPNDAVRLTASLSFFNRSLTDEIEKMHKEYQEAALKDYTVKITSYPFEVKKNSCAKYKSIDFKSSDKMEKNKEGNAKSGDTSNIRVDYVTYPQLKKPLFFKVRKYKGKFIMCEETDYTYKDRLSLRCGTEDLHTDAYDECKKDLTPSCSEIDSKGGVRSSQSTCASLDDFNDLSKSLLLSNKALEWKNCPSDCSYYTQTLQRVYKKQLNKGDYCSDNYLIVHCGPKKTKSKYNLNIREIKNLCSDFDNIDTCKV